MLLQQIETTADNIKNFRVLLITSRIYASWSQMRTRHLDGWSLKWCPETTCCAGPGAGALDAHYSLKAQIEHTLMTNLPFCGITSDLDKCIDRIIREIVIPLALKYGLPKDIPNTYLAYMNNIHIHNVYAIGLGTPRRRVSSLPKGCSFSLRFLA